MGYQVYVPVNIQLEAQDKECVRYRVDFEAAQYADTLEKALELAVSVCRAYYGDDDPSIRLEMGARSTLTAIEFYHPKYRPIVMGRTGYRPEFPAAIIRHNRNEEAFSRRFAFTMPVRFYDRQGVSIGV